MKQTRFHIQLDDQRTTISVDNLLVGLLAIKLGHEPETPDGNRAVRDCLQERLQAKVDTDWGTGKRASQHARVIMIEEIAAENLTAAYDKWIVER